MQKYPEIKRFEVEHSRSETIGIDHKTPLLDRTDMSAWNGRAMEIGMPVKYGIYYEEGG